jgi:cytochrome c oxidase assembly factor CtaG
MRGSPPAAIEGAIRFLDQRRPHAPMEPDTWCGENTGHEVSDVLSAISSFFAYSSMVDARSRPLMMRLACR